MIIFDYFLMIIYVIGLIICFTIFLSVPTLKLISVSATYTGMTLDLFDHLWTFIFLHLWKNSLEMVIFRNCRTSKTTTSYILSNHYYPSIHVSSESHVRITTFTLTERYTPLILTIYCLLTWKDQALLSSLSIVDSVVHHYNHCLKNELSSPDIFIWYSSYG